MVNGYKLMWEINHKNKINWMNILAYHQQIKNLYLKLNNIIQVVI